MDFSGRNKEGKTEPHELTWIPCLPSWSSFPKQHLESQVQFRQSWSLFTTMNPWHWRWSRTPMFKPPPSPTAHEMKRSFPGRCLCVCIFLMGLSFLKTLKSSLPCHPLYLTFHFLMTTFNNLCHPEFPLSPYTFIFYLQDTYFFCSLQRLAFMLQNGFSTAPSVSVLLPLPPPSFSLSPLLCSLLSKPHLPPCPITCTFTDSFSALRSYSALCYTVLYTCKWSFHSIKIAFPLGCLFRLQIFS